MKIDQHGLEELIIQNILLGEATYQNGLTFGELQMNECQAMSECKVPEKSLTGLLEFLGNGLDAT
jgi:hypothetical protein